MVINICVMRGRSTLCVCVCVCVCACVREREGGRVVDFQVFWQ